MRFAVTILGSGPAKPTKERLTSAHVLNVHEHFFLIDCGEGAQISMEKYGFSILKINHVFISHLHGDHYFGLIGLINSMHLFNRKRDLHIFCFPELEEIIRIQLHAANTLLSFQLKFHFLNNDQPYTILETKQLTVISFPLLHRIPTCGFLFREKKRSRNIRKDFVTNHHISPEWFPKILQGEDFIDEDGTLYPNESIVHIPSLPRTYAYCSDTAFCADIVPIIKNVSLLYHEASFTNEHKQHAKEKHHSTAAQAAQIAKLANAGELIIGHFSARYKDISPLLDEAKQIFSRTIEAKDGLTIDVNI
jgi:ribonuclease Z